MKIIRQSEVAKGGGSNPSRIVLTQGENGEYKIWVERLSRKRPELVEMGVFDTHEAADQDFDRRVSAQQKGS